MKIENKKTVILTVIAVLALVISVIGATYAYFTVNTDNTFGTPKIEAITGALGNVKLVSTENNLYLNLSREDMMEENADYYYAVTDPNGSPIGMNVGRGFEDIDEKFNNNEITGEEAQNELMSRVYPTIGYIEVDGAETYDCDYTFEVTIEGNMKEALTEGDTDALTFGLAMFDGEPELINFSNIIGDGYYYDIYSTEFPLEISGTLEDISSANKVYITAFLSLYTGYEQNHLIDKNIKLNIKAKSLSCTAKTPTLTLAEELISTVSSDELWDMTRDVGIDVMDVQEYRYVGTDPSNYICFGTTDKDTCLNDTDKYMYRIIGVFENSDGNQHAKLIKKEALNTAYKWTSSYTTDVDWNNSDLYNGLNGSYFLSNEDYPYMQDSTWTDKIATWNYTMTNTKHYENKKSTGISGLYYLSNSSKVIYLHELNRSGKSSETCYSDSNITTDCNVGEWKTLSTKISLMYLSDYALSLGSSALSYTSYSNYSTMKTGWMDIRNNDSGAPDSVEWTMTRRGLDALSVSSAESVGLPDGMELAFGPNAVHDAFAVRPVFYLTSDVEISGGTGTSSDPFILK